MFYRAFVPVLVGLVTVVSGTAIPQPRAAIDFIEASEENFENEILVLRQAPTAPTTSVAPVFTFGCSVLRTYTGIQSTITDYPAFLSSIAHVISTVRGVSAIPVYTTTRSWSVL